MSVSLCIATYRRPERLGALLQDLARQQCLPDEVVVVDNDAGGSARAVVEEFRARGAPFPIQYDIQPVKNISLTRNRTVALASGEWLAFVDDDERAPEAWLQQLLDTAQRYDARGVLGPVEPIVPVDAPAWIRQGTFYEWARMKTGSVVPPNKLRFGNVLLHGALLRASAAPAGSADSVALPAPAAPAAPAAPFDPEYGLTGGEDGDLLGRLVQDGARIVWCDEAVVHEPVESARLSLRWLLLRALRGGQDFARHTLRGRFGPLSAAGRLGFFVRALGQSALAAILALLSWPRGGHRSAYWLLKASANVGKMTILLGWHYREYGPGRPGDRPMTGAR